VLLICDWFGAGPGDVVEVVAPAFAVAVAVDSNAARTPTTIVSLTREARLRTVPRQFTASTAQQRNGCLVAYWASPLFPSVASRVRALFTFSSCIGSIGGSIDR
jgi:hypothetical protein